MQTFDELKAGFSNVAPIARGGQKAVFSASHPRFGSVVVKLFFKNDLRSQRELNICECLEVDCVPTIYESGHVLYESVETLYVVEKRIVGEVLRKRIEKGERFCLQEAVRFLEQGLVFIRKLEQMHIVHRDIKPENIIVSLDGKVYFLDFGIARILGVTSLTKTEAVVGPHTPGYAAPEQFNNLKNDIDSRADLFSLGVVAYECLSGKNPYREGAGTHFEILQRTETITPVKFQVEGDTQQLMMGIISSLMGKYPSRRPKNASQALDWLNAAKPTFQYREG